MARNSPAGTKNSTELKTLLGGLSQLFRPLSGTKDASAMRQAVTGLKPAYSKFFLKFG